MRLTRRGKVVAVAVVVAIGSGALFGARGLNGLAAPAVVALAAAAVHVRRLDGPSLEREVPDRGRRDETVPVRLHFSTDSPFSAVVADRVDAGLDATGNVRELTIGETTVRYDLHLRERGERTVGPLEVTARDVLGLVSRTFRYPVRHDVLVRPRIHLLAGARRDDLVALYGGAGDERREFDHLRTYERGDPVRNIHWKSSAKQPGDDLVVREYTADQGSRTLEVAAQSVPGCEDEMADAAASIVVDILESGVAAGLTTPLGRIAPDDGVEQRDRALDHLARAGAGHLPAPARTRADVVVMATHEGIRVGIGGQQCSFSELAGARIGAGDGTATAPPTGGGVAA